MTMAEYYELPELGYTLNALEPAYSAELLELHHSEHHHAYVVGANRAREELEEASRKEDFGSLSQLHRNLAFHVSGHILHSVFWTNMAPSHNTLPPENIALEVTRAFGGFDALRKQFAEAGAGLQGSGWAALCWEPVGGSLIVQQIYEHHNNASSSSVPLLVMDMWEHAYYLQYRNGKQNWIKAFWGLINWQDVADRLTTAQQFGLRLTARPQTGADSDGR